MFLLLISPLPLHSSEQVRSQPLLYLAKQTTFNYIRVPKPHFDCVGGSQPSVPSPVLGHPGSISFPFLFCILL